MQPVRPVFSVALAAVVFAVLYLVLQQVTFLLVPQAWLHQVALAPPFGSKALALGAYWGTFFLEFSLAAITAAIVPGITLAILSRERSRSLAIFAAILACAYLFMSSLFVVLRPRFIPQWFAFPVMVMIMIGAIVFTTSLMERLTRRSSATSQPRDARLGRA